MSQRTENTELVQTGVWVWGMGVSYFHTFDSVFAWEWGFLHWCKKISFFPCLKQNSKLWETVAFPFLGEKREFVGVLLKMYCNRRVESWTWSSCGTIPSGTLALVWRARWYSETTWRWWYINEKKTSPYKRTRIKTDIQAQNSFLLFYILN